MKEKALYRAIDKLLPVGVHRQSLTGASITMNGTPDRYYDGPKGDLWVEYKQLRALPRSGIVKGAYSELQLKWMERRFHHSQCLPHGTNIVGIVGLPTRKAVIQRTPAEWREGSLRVHVLTYREVAEWILGMCGS